MRKLSTAFITDTVGMPVKGGSLDHLQLAYQEAITALANNIIGRSADFTNAYILYGLVNSGSTGSMNVSAGAIYYGGEVFLVDAFTLTVGNTAVASLSTTYYGTNADPVTFTDGLTHNVHEIRKIVFTDGASGSGLFDFDDMLQTPLILKRLNPATLDAALTVNFKEDQSIFFDSATVNTTIAFDMTNAVPGTVVRLKWTYGSGRTLTLNSTGVSLVNDGGSIGSVADNTNVMYFLYAGKNGSDVDEISYTIKQV